MGSIPKTVGKYEVLGSIGRGGMGEVFKAYQPDLHRHVAIKTLLSGEQASPEFLERFQREARMAAKLAHPSIVPIFDIGAEGKLHYIVMEYVEGRSLRQILAERKFEPEKALRIAYTIARALQFAHERKIIHRDIKPANLLLDKQGRVRVLDFGLARSLDGKGLTATSTMLGTPYYMSPEQAFGAPEELDPRTDLYSLGAVLYEMLTGRPPFEGGTVLAILRKIEDDDPAAPGISPAVDALVLRALAKDRERRFQTAAEMAEALRTCLSGKSPVTEVARVPAPRRRAPAGALWGLAGALSAAFVILLTWAFWPAAAEVPAPAPPKPIARPVAPPDPAAELRALLERKNEVSSAELARFREDPRLRRLIADHYLQRGQYTRALEDLKGYDRAIMELASARSLQRFVSPGLFRVSIAQPRDVKGPEAFLMAALGRHLEGKPDAARQKLKAALNNDALRSHALLVRAHLDLTEILQNPGDDAMKPLLADLRRELDKSNELFILPLRAIAAQLAGDGATARDLANLLSRSAPSSAETFLLSAILFLRAGRSDLAADEVEEAARMDVRTWDSTILRAYVRWMEVLNDPANEKLESGAEGEKMDLVEMREALDARLKHDHYPAGLLLRAAIECLDGRWDAAEEDLRRLERRLNGRLELASVDHDRLGALVDAIGSRSRLLNATAELQQHLGRLEASYATSLLINGEELPEEERRELLRHVNRRMAHQQRSRLDWALWHVEQALENGLPPQELRADDELGDLRRRPGFESLLRKYERR